MTTLQLAIHFEDQATNQLNSLRLRLVDMSPALKEIGESLKATTKHRFDTATGPDGQGWKSNETETLHRILRRYSHWRGKRAQERKAQILGKKPLTDRGTLKSTITWQLAGPSTLLIGSPQEYAATHQFGARKGEFGSNKRGAPIPWGDIPARPFLGLSPDDQAIIKRLLLKHLTAS